mgnify:CR=1 FL=1
MRRFWIPAGIVPACAAAQAQDRDRIRGEVADVGIAHLVDGALLVALPAETRPLGWTDLLLAVPALLLLVVTWALVEQLLENASALREWSRARD